MIPRPYQKLFAQIDQAAYHEAVGYFRAHGIISMGHSDRRRPGWNLMAIGRPDGPTTVIVWVDLEGFVGLIEDRAGTLKAFHDQGAKVTLAS